MVALFCKNAPKFENVVIVHIKFGQFDNFVHGKG